MWEEGETNEIRFTVKELKELLKKEEQTECKSECSIETPQKSLTDIISDINKKAQESIPNLQA